MELIKNGMKIVLPTAALFVAVIVCLAFRPEKIKKVIAKMALGIAVGAMFSYGYGYANQTANQMPPSVAVIRSTMDALRIFVGGNNWDAVKTAYPANWQQFLFWLLHLVALFTSASAVITSLGSRLIRRIRMRLLPLWDISVIYGLNDSTLSFAAKLMDQGVRSVLFVEQNPSQALSDRVERKGCVLRSDPQALKATPKFLKSIGAIRRKRKLHVYALGADAASNRQYAQHILESLQKCDVAQENTTLTLLCTEEDTAQVFLRSEARYGFGSVLAVNEPEMAARMLIHAFPPCDVICFDNQGRAQNSFHGVVIGFGHIGQAVLKQLVVHGQFTDNSFRAAVFSPRYSQRMGFMAHECGQMLKHYDISFYDSDGRSCEVYDYLAKHADSVNYIALCTGKDASNMEIAEQLRVFFRNRNMRTPIYMCSNNGIFYQNADGQLEPKEIYDPKILCSDQIDRMAMVLHHHYIGVGDMRENWKNCNYFDRMSSRSAADFLHTILRAAGTTEASARGNWAPRGELLENLAKMEHLRWNAFHYAMGFRPMTEEEYEARVAEFLRKRSADPNTTYRIARDMERRIHACMIPWESLDRYSDKENAVTGQNRDYAENDRQNICAMKDVLQKMDIDL